MVRIATVTDLPPREVINKAVAAFGPTGYNLKITGQTDNWANFEGGGGAVEISAEEENGKTKVDFVSREWDYQVKEFINSIR